MSGGICDHCGGVTQAFSNEENVVWCKQCVLEDADLLNAVGLVTSEGDPIVTPKDSGEVRFGLADNITKIRAIPHKGSKVPESELPIVQAEASSNQEKIDFDKYNSVLPGKRHVIR